MARTLLEALRDARAALEPVLTAEAGEAIVARRLVRELDETIARLEGLPAPRELVSVVCHDLKDPLASVVMGAGFLKKTVPADTADGAARRVIDAIARSGDRMSRLVGDLHDMTKLEAGTLAVEVVPCDVASVVRAAVATMEETAREREIGVEAALPDAPLVAKCDRARLGQIVAKLVGNAIKFARRGGHVVVRAERCESGVRVTVADDGAGIAPERIETIFDRAANQRRSPRDGPGLGLPIVRGLLELQGGTIEVASEVGKGSTFVFTLPR